MKAISSAIGRTALMLALVPLAAQAQPAFTSQTVNMRAGPSPDYPLVTQLPAGVTLDVEGCTDGYQWCDVLLPDGLRGWVDAQSLSHRKQGRQLVMSQFGSVIGIPVLSFDVGRYWSAHYRDRPYYEEPGHWRGLPPQRYAQAPREQLFPPPSYIGRAPGIVGGQNSGIAPQQPPAFTGQPQPGYPQARVYGVPPAGTYRGNPSFGNDRGYDDRGYDERGRGDRGRGFRSYDDRQQQNQQGYPQGGWQQGNSPAVRVPQPWVQQAPPLQPPMQQNFPGQQIQPGLNSQPGYLQR